MIGAVILAHLVGDYLLQSHWMANEKVKRWFPAVVHGITYTLPFLFITLNPWSLLIIAGTHAVIDRYRLAKHFSYLKNLIGPRDYYLEHTWPDGVTKKYTKDQEWTSVDTAMSRPIHFNMSIAPPFAKKVKTRRFWIDYKPQNGYPPGTPDWMSTWLMIITDNTLHILIAVICILLIG